MTNFDFLWKLRTLGCEETHQPAHPRTFPNPDAMQTAAAAAQPALPEILHYIDGRYVGSDRPLFENRHPATGRVSSLVAEADAEIGRAHV